MKKSVQREINKKVEYELERYNGITEQWEIKEIGRLYKCQAFVYETDFYFVLRSYSTIVAVIQQLQHSILQSLQENTILTVKAYTWKEVK